MANIQKLDPDASPLDFYGGELRRLREAARLTQPQLGDMIYCTGSLIGQVETTKKIPTRDFSERVDAALRTDGMFSRLVGLVLRSQLPPWFLEYADMERKATYISTYQAQLVYGLLQTEEYARAVLATGMPEDLDGMLAARMERQRVLRKKNPPLALVILDEAVLYRPIGGEAVMRAQLQKLLDFAHHRWVRIQVCLLYTQVRGRRTREPGRFVQRPALRQRPGHRLHRGHHLRPHDGQPGDGQGGLAPIRSPPGHRTLRREIGGADQPRDEGALWSTALT